MGILPMILHGPRQKRGATFLLTRLPLWGFVVRPRLRDYDGGEILVDGGMDSVFEGGCRRENAAEEDQKRKTAIRFGKEKVPMKTTWKILVAIVMAASLLTVAAEEKASEPKAQVGGGAQVVQQATESQPAGMEGPPRGMPRGRGRPGRGGPSTSPVETRTIPKSDAEKKILAVLEDMYQNQSRGMMNVSPEDGRVLRLLTETVGAKHVVEVGTSNGYSGIWFCLALRTTGGKLTTHEIDRNRASLARENFKRAGADPIVTLVEGNAHETVKNLKEPIDVLFLDADKEGYFDYFNKLLPLVRPGGLILAHNTSMAGGMQDYLKAITTSADLETIFVRESGAGISVTLKKR